MSALRNAIVVCALTAGCSAGAATPSTSATPATVTATTVTATTTVVVPPSSTLPATSQPTTTVAPRPLAYVFPFTGKKVSYGHTQRLPGKRRVRLRRHRCRADRRDGRPDANLRSVGAHGQRPGNPRWQVRVDARRRRRALLLRPSRLRRRATGRCGRRRRATWHHGPNRRRP